MSLQFGIVGGRYSLDTIKKEHPRGVGPTVELLLRSLFLDEGYANYSLPQQPSYTGPKFVWELGG